MAISQRYLTIDNGHMILTGNTLMIYQQNVVNDGPFITTNAALQVPGYPPVPPSTGRKTHPWPF